MEKLIDLLVEEGDALRLGQDVCLLCGLRLAAGLEESLPDLGTGAWIRKAIYPDISKSVPES